MRICQGHFFKATRKIEEHNLHKENYTNRGSLGSAGDFFFFFFFFSLGFGWVCVKIRVGGGDGK